MENRFCSTRYAWLWLFRTIWSKPLNIKQGQIRPAKIWWVTINQSCKDKAGTAYTTEHPWWNISFLNRKINVHGWTGGLAGVHSPFGYPYYHPSSNSSKITRENCRSSKHLPTTVFSSEGLPDPMLYFLLFPCILHPLSESPNADHCRPLKPGIKLLFRGGEHVLKKIIIINKKAFSWTFGQGWI